MPDPLKTAILKGLQIRSGLSGVIRANRFARFAQSGARIGNSSDSGESASRAIKIGV